MASRTVLVSRRWNGRALIAQGARAQAQATIRMLNMVAADAKELAHVISGTMQRSIHSAPADYQGETDFSRAWEGEDLQVTESLQMHDIVLDSGTMVMSGEVGSWVPYASVEEIDRDHQFLQPAYDNFAGRVDKVMFEEWRKAGM